VDSQTVNPTNQIPQGLTASQWAAILQLRAQGDLPSPTTEDNRPASIYTSPAHFDREKRDLLTQVPMVIAPTAYLPDSNTSVALDGYGLPLLLNRDRNGVVRVFVNACRHKGAKLLDSCEPVKSGRVTCPYHAWSFAMDGKLVGIPRPEVFPSADKSRLGLVELPSFEGGGLIWATLNPKAELNKLEGTAQVVADLEAFGLHKMVVYGRRVYDLKANWKAVMEPFLEPYHIHRLHADSIARMFVDGPTVATHLGPSIRQTSGKANFDPAILQGEVDNIHKYVTHAYTVFPNTVIITSPYYMSVMILMPRAAGRTVVDYYMLLNEQPQTDKARDIASRSYAMIHEVFGGEDFKASQLQQEGLESGAIDTVYFGGLEEMIGPYHAAIETFLQPQA
jgi:phenylpropionate dioxygenase-like ring-hydroxylating dioxygenase large terminal subunit